MSEMHLVLMAFALGTNEHNELICINKLVIGKAVAACVRRHDFNTLSKTILLLISLVNDCLQIMGH